MKQELTVERVRELLQYDSETGILTWKVRALRSKTPAGTVAGCASGNGYLIVGVDGATYLAHRLAWLHFYGVWPELDVDHMDGIRSHNSIGNLRLASKSKNAQNVRRAHLDSASGILGVWRKKGRNKWTTAIKVDGQLQHLGNFASPQEAQEVYLKAKRELHAGCLL